MKDYTAREHINDTWLYARKSSKPEPLRALQYSLSKEWEHRPWLHAQRARQVRQSSLNSVIPKEKE